MSTWLPALLLLALFAGLVAAVNWAIGREARKLAEALDDSSRARRDLIRAARANGSARAPLPGFSPRDRARRRW